MLKEYQILIFDHLVFNVLFSMFDHLVSKKIGFKKKINQRFGVL